MKTLKGILTAVLILGMSTGFAAPSVEKPKIQIKLANKQFYVVDTENLKNLNYKNLDESAQAEVDEVVNQYCDTGELYIKGYQNKIKNTVPYVVGSAVFTGTGFFTGFVLEGLEESISHKNWMRASNLGLVALIGGAVVLVISGVRTTVLQLKSDDVQDTLDKFCSSADRQDNNY